MNPFREFFFYSNEKRPPLHTLSILLTLGLDKRLVFFVLLNHSTNQSAVQMQHIRFRHFIHSSLNIASIQEHEGISLKKKIKKIKAKPLENECRGNENVSLVYLALPVIINPFHVERKFNDCYSMNAPLNTNSHTRRAFTTHYVRAI